MTIINSIIQGANAYQNRAKSLAQNISAAGAIASKQKETFITAFDLNQNSLHGVQSVDRRFLNQVGPSIETSESSNFSIIGDGYICVKKDPYSNDTYYTRNGTFTKDKNGFLMNSDGLYLLGYTASADEKVNSSQNVNSLIPINLSKASLSSQSTKNIDHSILFNQDANTFSYQVNVFQPTGEQEILTFNFEKHNEDLVNTGEGNTGWNVTVLPSASELNGTTYSASEKIRIEIDSSGKILGFVKGTETTSSEIAPDLNIKWKNSGAASSITMNFNDFQNAQQVLGNATSDGHLPGKYESVTFDKNGFGHVSYSNGKTLPFCRIPLALFPNINKLDEEQPALFKQTSESGNVLLGFGQTQGYGYFLNKHYEGSTIDSTKEYIKSIENQKHFMATLKLIEMEKAKNAKLENI